MSWPKENTHQKWGEGKKYWYLEKYLRKNVWIQKMGLVDQQEINGLNYSAQNSKKNEPRVDWVTGRGPVGELEWAVVEAQLGCLVKNIILEAIEMNLRELKKNLGKNLQQMENYVQEIQHPQIRKKKFFSRDHIGSIPSCRMDNLRKHSTYSGIVIYQMYDCEQNTNNQNY